VLRTVEAEFVLATGPVGTATIEAVPHAVLRARSNRARVMLLAAGLALGPGVALGLARFAYSLLLPAMRADLGWSFGQAGVMNTANALGYLAGAVVAAPLFRRVGTRRCYAAGMALAAASMLGAGLTGNFTLQLLLRLTAGLGGAGTYIGGAGLVAKLAQRAPSRPGTLVSVYTAGAGAGIVVSGLIVPPILGAPGAGGWRLAWLALAALAAASLLAVLPALARLSEPDPPAGAGPESTRTRALVLPGIAYLLFGGGYIAYATFVIADLEGHGFGSGQVTAFWALLGATVFVGVPLWGRALDRLRSGHALAMMTGVLVVGALLPLLAGGLAVGLASGVIFGSSFLAVPAGMVALVRHRLPSTAWNAGIAGLTVAFAAGQTAGPGLAGMLADRAGGANLGLLLGAVTLGAATLVYVAGEGGRPASPGRRA
jgi:predicted MFS family arabinose efflux permease